MPPLIQSYSKIETIVPGIDTNPADINPGGPTPLYFNDVFAGGVTTMTLVGERYAAGLSKRVVTLPEGVSRFTFTYAIRPSQLAALYAQVYENDLMFVDSKSRRYNGSVRKNCVTGEWEIVNVTGDWVPTGFKPAPFAPDVWTTVTIVFQINWTAFTLSVVSITDGTKSFTVTAPLPQNNPAITTDNPPWQADIIDWQSQGTLNTNVIVGAIASYTQEMMNVCVYGQ